jgi:hypothetical protein
MSSSTSSGARALVVLLALGALALGCGRSPAMPSAPVKLVRAENGRAVPCNCADDDDDDDLDDDATTKHRRGPVEYVHMSEWQAPASAQRAEAGIAPRGSATPTYIEFPKLTLHKPIPETTVSGRGRRVIYR